MQCPRDGADLATRVHEGGVEIDTCPACGGSFLDQGELEKIQAAVEADHRRKHLERPPASAEPVDDAQARQPLVGCPKCQQLMERRRYGMGCETLIDVCPDGHGLWLDRGELEELERFYEESHAEVEIPIAWRLWAAVRGALKR